MFLFSFIGSIIEIGGGLFLCFYLMQDYRHGWRGVRGLLDKGPEFLERFSVGRFARSPEGKARLRLKQSAKELHITRESVAEVQATAENLRQKERESAQLKKEAEKLAMEAEQAGDELGLRAAVMHKLACQNREEAFRKGAEEIEVSIPELLRHLGVVELQHERTGLEVEGIGVDDAISRVTNHVYGLLSDVGPEGYTDSGELQTLRDESRNRKIKSGKMLELVRGKSEQKLTMFLEDKEINEAIAEVKQKAAALPAPEQSSSAVGIEYANGLAADAEIVQ